jgi:glycosyltransferase involved in cell wall biosynthesis
VTRGSDNLRKARVLFDIAELGPYAYTGNGGVRRVIENVARRLLRNSTVDVAFTGLAPVAARGVVEQLGAPDAKFHTCGNALLEQISAAACGFTARTAAKRNIVLRTVRRSLRPLLELDRRLSEGTPATALKWAEIFHSNFRPLPQRVQQQANITKFLTIYDLIPTHWPELTSPHFTTVLEQILASVRSDTWIVCISQWAKNDVCKMTGASPERVFVMPLAASRDVFRRPADDELTATLHRFGLNDVPYVLSVGAMDARKNIAHLIESSLPLQLLH